MNLSYLDSFKISLLICARETTFWDVVRYRIMPIVAHVLFILILAVLIWGLFCLAKVLYKYLKNQ